MKFLLTFFIILIAPFLELHDSQTKQMDKGIEAYTETGHDQFKKITPADEEVKILYEMSDDYIDGLLKELKGKLFGEREKIINLYADATYISETIFSRSNSTREAFSFIYNTSTVVYNEVSVSVKGNINAKGTFKGKNKELIVNGEITGSYATESSLEDTVEDKFSVVIYPGKKVTLRIVGDCKISNGVKKQFFVGIRTRKGAWEVIDVTSTCCELIEEDA